jgi:hypothetical protein
MTPLHRSMTSTLHACTTWPARPCLHDLAGLSPNPVAVRFAELDSYI